MGKKCIPGSVICIENMTLFVIVFIAIVVFYIYYVQFHSSRTRKGVVGLPSMISYNNYLGAVPTRLDDPYVPPVRTDSIMPSLSMPIRTQPYQPNYSHVGILANPGGGGGGGGSSGGGGGDANKLILPLMGRRHNTNRSKWQYYTTSATGTKLPVNLAGRSCTGEYGCDELSSGDFLYVEGYNGLFQFTAYDNASFAYA